MNNIFWNNEESITYFESWNGECIIDNSLLENGINSLEHNDMSTLVYGENNLEIDPLFSTDPGSYMLQETSPCIDAGDPKANCSQEPAPNGGRVNVGAYGNSAEASKSIEK